MDAQGSEETCSSFSSQSCRAVISSENSAGEANIQFATTKSEYKPYRAHQESLFQSCGIPRTMEQLKHDQKYQILLAAQTPHFHLEFKKKQTNHQWISTATLKQI